MFPEIPSQSRFNCRRRHLMLAFNLIRRSVLQMLDLAHERQNVIDSLPIPVVRFYLAWVHWRLESAWGNLRESTTRNEIIFGYKLHL